MYTNENSIFNMSPGFRMVLFISMTGLSMILGGLVTFSIVAAALNTPFTDIQSVLLRPENTSLTQIANAFASINFPARKTMFVTKTLAVLLSR